MGNIMLAIILLTLCIIILILVFDPKIGIVPTRIRGVYSLILWYNSFKEEAITRKWIKLITFKNDKRGNNTRNFKSRRR